MAEEYYAEEFSSMPLGPMAEIFKRFMPAYIAYSLAAYYRARNRLGIPPRATYGTGPVGSGRYVARNELSPRILSQWAPILEQLHDLGFREVYYRIADAIGAKESVAALFLDKACTTFAMLQWLRLQGAKLEEQSPLEFNSFCIADPEIMTGMVEEEHLVLADALKLDFVDQLVVGKRTGVRKTYQLHLDRIRDRSVTWYPLEIANDEFTKRSQRRFDSVLQRGFLRRLSAAEIQSVKKCRLP
jgi:hypothetical protein